MKLHFVLNGQPQQAEVPPGTTLLALLRDHLGLTGTKPGCEIGECGACTVLVDGRAVTSCTLLAAQIDGSTVLTIEGLRAPDGGLTDLQRAFLEAGATQCGYCVPGMILAAEALLQHTSTPTRAEIRETLGGNLCRCTGYQPILEAIEATARQRRLGLPVPSMPEGAAS